MTFKRVVRLTAILACAAYLMSIAPVAQATSGPLILTKTTTLAEDHVGNIVIARNGITLDCAGHRVVGSTGDGITIAKRSGITVRNCDVSGFATGFWVVETSGSTLVDNTAHDNDDGLRLFQARNNLLLRNSALTNAQNGFVLAGAATKGNRVEDSASQGSKTGFAITEGAAGNRVLASSASSNADHGFLVDFGASENLLDANEATGNGVGFTLANDASGNRLASNTSSSNVQAGYLIVNGARGNSLEANVATGNPQGGFVLLGGARSNRLTSNVADANPGVGFHLIDSDENSLAHNVALGSGAAGFRTVDGSTGNRLTENAASNGAASGFVVFEATENALIGNVSTNNGLRGFNVIGAGTSNNRLEDNSASGNGAACFDGQICGGFAVVFGATLNALIGNTADDNFGYGFGLVSATANSLSSNRACGNALFDGFQDATSSGNVWASNSFCATDGI